MVGVLCINKNNINDKLLIAGNKEQNKLCTNVTSKIGYNAIWQCTIV